MAFSGPPSPPAAPPAPPSRQSLTLAQASAMGTTQGAPVMQIAKGPPGGSGLPGSGPPPAAPGNAQQPPGVGAAPPAPAAGPPVGVAANPVVAAHAQPSVGTHLSRSPNKRADPTHGWSK